MNITTNSVFNFLLFSLMVANIIVGVILLYICFIKDEDKDDKDKK